MNESTLNVPATPLETILQVARRAQALRAEDQKVKADAEEKLRESARAEAIAQARAEFVDRLRALFAAVTGYPPPAETLEDGRITQTEDYPPYRFAWELVPGLQLRLYAPKNGEAEITYTHPSHEQRKAIHCLADLGEAIEQIETIRQRQAIRAEQDAVLDQIQAQEPPLPEPVTIIEQGLHGGLRIIPLATSLEIYPFITPIFGDVSATGRSMAFRFTVPGALQLAQALRAGEGTVTADCELALVVVGEGQLEWVQLPGATYDEDARLGLTMRLIFTKETLTEFYNAVSDWLAFAKEYNAWEVRQREAWEAGSAIAKLFAS